MGWINLHMMVAVVARGGGLRRRSGVAAAWILPKFLWNGAHSCGTSAELARDSHRGPTWISWECCGHSSSAIASTALIPVSALDGESRTGEHNRNQSKDGGQGGGPGPWSQMAVCCGGGLIAAGILRECSRNPPRTLPDWCGDPAWIVQGRRRHPVGNTQRCC